MHNCLLFAPKQTSARIDFLRQGGRWWTKMALIMLNILLKTIQNKCAKNTREWTKARKTCRLATARASVCGTYCSRTTRTASCKRRSDLLSTSGFQLVETVLNNFRSITFWGIATLCHQQMGQNFKFHRILVWHFVHELGAYLVFTAQRHRLLSIWGNTKSQDNEKKIIKKNCYFIFYL